jgi:hypothetical protein
MFKKMFEILTISVVSLLFTTLSLAATVNTAADLKNNQKISAYIFSNTMLETMSRLGAEQDRKFNLQTDCKSKYKLKPISVAVLSPIDLPEGKKNPIKGAWKIRYEFERCGASKVYNVLFKANDNGETPEAQADYPGSSNADPVLIKDAISSRVLRIIARSGPKTCKDIEVFDMTVTKDAHTIVEQHKTYNGVWNENWTFMRCGQKIDVEMTFIPDPKEKSITFICRPVSLNETNTTRHVKP